MKGIVHRVEDYLQTDITYLTQGSFWLLLGKGGLFAISAIMMVAFANLLPQETFGSYQYVLAFLGLLGIFSLPGLNIALVRSISQKKEGDFKRALRIKFKWSLLGALGMCLGAAWYFYHGQNLLATSFLIGGLFLPPYMILPIFDAYWNGKKRFDLKSKYEILVALLALGFIIPILFITDNLAVLLFVFLFSYTLWNGFFLWRTLRKIENSNTDRESIGLGKNLTIIRGITLVAEHIDKILLWKLLGPVHVAVYTFASLPIQKLISFNPLGPLVLPKLSEPLPNQRKKDLPKKLLKSFTFTVPGAFLLILVAPLIYQLFLPQYTESAQYFQVLGILLALTPLALINMLFVAESRKKELYIVTTVRSIAKVVLYLGLIPIWGIWGVVIGYIIGTVLGDTLLVYFFLRNYSFLPTRVK
ncbi:MAG: oligosaccharide flippase family protein [Candidatus Yanofskybacteria bacterium]|nr:oligosaccharide flippase family protein [Candidatus Yanofskybacteria bacterium]